IAAKQTSQPVAASGEVSDYFQTSGFSPLNQHFYSLPGHTASIASFRAQATAPVGFDTSGGTFVTGVIGSGSTYGVSGFSPSSIGVDGNSLNGGGVRGDSATNGYGVEGISGDGGAGVIGIGTNGYGVAGGATTGYGVAGFSDSATGVYGET